MSTHCARLAAPPADPLRKQFVADVRQRFRPIRGRIRHFAGYQTDGFGLRSDTQQARLADGDDTPDSWPDPPTNVYQFQTAEAKADAFVEWLQDALRDDLLEELPSGRIRRLETAPERQLPDLLQGWDHWTTSYLRGAYTSAWEAAGGRLQSAGVSTAPTQLPDDLPVAAAFDIGVRSDTLRRAYLRTYGNLKSIADEAAADTVRETITTGIAEGVNPRELARRLTNDVRGLQRTRAEVLARTEVHDTYVDSSLDRYEAADVNGVVHGEWSDSGDARVCPVCKSLDGTTFTIQEIRTGTFTFEPSEEQPDYLAGEYRLKPPAHPGGRCVPLPKVN